MKTLSQLFENNREWAAELRASDPHFFSNLASRQAPDYLWIGCSDSRVPASQVVGLRPGELFVHRNIANLVIHDDLSALSVLQYAVEVLKVGHVIVCGHYGCGGVKAAMETRPHGLVDDWLRHIRDIHERNRDELEAIVDVDQRMRRLCELNVIEQVINVGNTSILQDAWGGGQRTSIHGWIYDIADGTLQDLETCVSSRDELDALQKRR